ncbi:MAG: GGDEF domain-containing protein [Chloroflexi bacterium]|nr:GGDEF domain-containing protein [Chloroflexota bacterium]
MLPSQNSMPPDLMAKYKRQTYLLAFPAGIVLTLLYAFIIAKSGLQFYIAIFMIVELALFMALVKFIPRSISIVDPVFYFSYASYLLIVTQLNLNYALHSGLFAPHMLAESINSLTLWLIVFMVGAYLAMNPNYVRAFFVYIFLVVFIMAVYNIWSLYFSGRLESGLLFRWINPIAGLSLAALLIQRMGALQQKYATTDSLTGLLNRRALYRILEQEMERFVRYGTPFSIILFDMDYFKNVNDTHGHLAGDNALKSLSDLAENTIRRMDSLGRWGGEEFLIVLPGTDSEQARILAGRLCLMVKEHPFGKVQKLTASFGVTTSRPGGSLEDMLHRADHAMYRAKQSGRGKVVADFS